MSRLAKRTDENHSAVRDDIKAALKGCTVFDLSGAGRGCPDLMVGWRGRNYLFELKNPEQMPSRRKLTGAQEKFHAEWQGHAAVVMNAAEAIASILAHETKL